MGGKGSGWKRPPNPHEKDAVKRALGGETYQSIADDFGVTRERVRQWCTKNGLGKHWKLEQIRKVGDERSKEVMALVCETGNVTEACAVVGVRAEYVKRYGYNPTSTKCYQKAHNKCIDCGVGIGTFRYRGRRCKPCGLRNNIEKFKMWKEKYPERYVEMYTKNNKRASLKK